MRSPELNGTCRLFDTAAFFSRAAADIGRLPDAETGSLELHGDSMNESSLQHKPSLSLVFGRRHIFHLHIGKMAGRSLMDDGPAWLELPPCRWLRDLPFHGSMDRQLAMIRARARPRAPCFASLEADLIDVTAAYQQAPVGRAPRVVTLLRSPMGWVVSAAMHYQRMGYQHNGEALHRNDGLEDLVRSGCFFELGQDLNALRRSRKCRTNYGFPTFAVARLMSHSSLSQLTGSALGQAGVEELVSRAKATLDRLHVGLVESYTASLCLWRHELGLPLFDMDCQNLCRSATSATATLREHRVSNDAVVTPQDVNISNNLSATALNIIEKSMLPYSRIYAYATNLFSQRAVQVEKSIGLQLLC